jgi:hypothetical protein
MDITKLAIACEHDKIYKHQEPILDRFGQPVGFGKWCEGGRFVTFFDLVKEFAVEMVAALVAEKVLDADGQNPEITWDADPDL